MPPWSYQGEFERQLAKLQKGGGRSVAELLERALAEPRLSYKGVVGALVNALRKAKRKQRLPLLTLLSTLCTEAAAKWGAKNLFGDRIRPDLARCVACACRCPSGDLDKVSALLSDWTDKELFPTDVLNRCYEALERAVLAGAGAENAALSASEDEGSDEEAQQAAEQAAEAPAEERRKGWAKPLVALLTTAAPPAPPAPPPLPLAALQPHAVAPARQADRDAAPPVRPWGGTATWTAAPAPGSTLERVATPGGDADDYDPFAV